MMKNEKCKMKIIGKVIDKVRLMYEYHYDSMNMMNMIPTSSIFIPVFNVCDMIYHGSKRKKVSINEVLDTRVVS